MVMMNTQLLDVVLIYILDVANCLSLQRINGFLSLLAMNSAVPLCDKADSCLYEKDFYSRLEVFIGSG